VHISSVFTILISAIPLSAAVTIHGTVVDPSDAAIPGAQVAAVTRLGVDTRATSDALGNFDLRVDTSAPYRVIITAPGFETRTVTPGRDTSMRVKLALAPQSDSVSVVGSTMDIPASQQGGSVSIIPGEEIRERNEPAAVDLLRYVPGMAVSQAGPVGSATGLFIRGGNSNFNLVQIDGVTVNSFGLGVGGFDFAHIPSDWLDRIEVIRGAQSAVYGSYANTGVINFVPRGPDEGPTLDVLAEGGSHEERRFAVGGSVLVKGFGVSAYASRLDTSGPVQNNDYHNQNISLRLNRNMARQSLAFHGNFNNNDVGVPGAYGSNPVGLYPGLDLISRNKNNFSDYLAHYRIDLSNRVRQEVFGTFFLENSFFASPYGDSYNKDIRAQGEARTIVSVSDSYNTAFGVAFYREELKNTFVTDAGFRSFPLRRDQTGIYWENRFHAGPRFFLNAGARAEVIRTPKIPTDGFRPELAANTLTRVNPKVAVGYVLKYGARLHASFGTGIRPPAGLELAFTDNPGLKPERTTSFDFGIDQRLWHNTVSLEATYFYNRFSDLIVSLGGSLAQLSAFKTDNLANSRAQGAEFAARVRPARWIFVAGTYTYLASEILALSGSSSLAPNYFRVGQELIRRPKHSGAVTTSLLYRNLTANITGYFRGKVLDAEPNIGVSGGLFLNPGYANIGINVNYRLPRGVTVYGNLRNAFNQRYEEVFGYPSPLLNFVAGLKWSLSRSGW
jgi:outer membrane cobalamin receptor